MSEQFKNTSREYEITDLYRQAFGYTGAPFPAGNLINIANPIELGKEIIGDLKRVRGLQLGIPQFMPLSIEGIILDIEPLITLSASKKIIRTPINGGKKRGTVKELFARDDWRIRIQGFVESGDQEYPIEEIQDIRGFYEANKTVAIDNEILRALGIQYMAIERLNLPEMTGVRNMQAFQLSGYSDDYPERELDLG